MSRDDGFAVADIDSSKYDDAKMRALWQFLRDESKMARATCLHDATILASWRHGERLTVREACPLWLTADDEIIAALVAAKLIGKDLKVAPSSWKHWFGTAIERREVSRAKGRLGGLAKAERARRNNSPATAQLEPGSSPALPVRPSVPTVPTDRPTDARADLDAFFEVRFRAPTPAQRTFLDGYVQTFDLTGPERAARLILAHPDDPIGALKEDLAAFRDQRRAEAAASEVPKPAARRAPRPSGVNAEISKMWREQEEQREQERLERMAAGGAA